MLPLRQEKTSAPIQYLSMLQVDVLHFSHFPTWQKLELWLCLGLPCSGSWILILARGFFWQVRSLVRMQGASSAFALESAAQTALLLLPGAQGQRSRRGAWLAMPSPLSLSPLTFVAITRVGGIRGAGCTLSRDEAVRTEREDLRGKSA